MRKKSDKSGKTYSPGIESSKKPIIDGEQKKSFMESFGVHHFDTSTPIATILESSPIAIGITRISDGTFLYINSEMAKQAGTTIENLIGTSAIRFWVDPDEREMLISQFNRGISIHNREVRFYRFDRTEYWGLLSWEKIVYNEENCILFWLFNIDKQKRTEGKLKTAYDKMESMVQERTRDLTDEIKRREETEKALSQSEMRHRLLFENSGTAIYYIDRNGTIEMLNRPGARRFHSEPDRIIGQDFYSLLPEKVELIRSRIEQVIQTGLGNIFETHITERGRHYWFMDNIQPLSEKGEEITAVQYISTNITKYKKTELEKMRLVEILEATSDLVSTAWTDSRIFYLNRAGRQMLGIGAEEDITDKLIPHIHPPWAFKIIKAEAIPEAERRGVWEGETAILNRDKKEIPVSQVIMAHRSPEGNIEYYSTIMRDITQQKKTEATIRDSNRELNAVLKQLQSANEAYEKQNRALISAQEELKKSEEKFRSLIENAADLIILHDFNGKLIDVNRGACTSLGYSQEELVKLKITDIETDLIGSAGRTFEWEKLRTVSSETCEKTYKRKDGSTFPVEIRMSLLSLKGIDTVILIARDITERKNAQELLIQTEKMMTVGSMAAGIAHEINNPLGIILQGIQMTIGRTSPHLETNRREASKLGTDLEVIRTYLSNRGIFKYLKGMKEASIRSTVIISNMLNFSRMDTLEKSNEDINRLVENSLSMASKDYDLAKAYDFKNIRIRKNLSLSLPKTPCIKTEIEQVFLNILKNSAQAISEIPLENYRGEIVINTRKQKSFIVIEMSDNGPGIDSGTINHIFEPFYTTKETGKGTGLGLSVSYFIIRNHHEGTIEVSSTPGFGALFRIKLPISSS